MNIGDAPSANPAATVTITGPTPQGSTSTNNAAADATSTQVSPENVNASIRVNSPGADGAVHQTNSSSASAAAGASGPDGSSNTAAPTANSTQISPVNVNVNVRVGSPGDNAPVTQANTSDATAANIDPSSVVPVIAEFPGDGPNSYAEVQNTSGVIQDLAQCADDETDCVTGPGSGTDPNATGLTASAPDLSSATASQSNPSNVTVSVRVASPGHDGLATQLNNANASGATAVTTTTDPDNLVVGIEVPGDPNSVVVPTDPNTPWIWNWNWTTGTAPTDPSQTPFDSPNWNWNWTVPEGAVPASASTNSPDAPAPTPGQWTWTWIWTRGDGWTTTWTYSQACNCSWSWVWTWTWPADTPSTQQQATAAPTDVPPPPSKPQITQTNEAISAAAAITSFDSQQSASLTTDGDPMDATRYQGITSTQTASADADVIQTSPENWSVVTAGNIDAVTQRNRGVATSAAATFDTSQQTITQTHDGTNDGAVHTTTAIQVITTAQGAAAKANTLQTRITNLNHVWSATPGQHAQIGAISQLNEAVSASYADGWNFVTQTIDQSLLGGGADQSALAIQQSTTTQTAFSDPFVAQTNLRNRTSIQIPWNGLWNPPIDQSNIVSAGAMTSNYSEVVQSIAQQASGEDVAWNMVATQTSIVNQGGASAHASASQTGNENFAGWNGILASPPAPTSGASGAGGGGGGNGSSAVGPQPSIIVGATPVGHPGVTAGVTRTFTLSAHGLTVRKPFFLAGGARFHAHGPTRVAPRHHGPKAGYIFHHVFLNLLSAMQRALLLLLGATPFAALMALFTIAALGAARLQYPALALGRSATFARRERPG